MILRRMVRQPVQRAVLLFALGGALGAAPPVPDPAGPEPADLNALIRSATRAMHAGDFEAATRAYEAMRALRPDSAEIPYNLGVAAYRSGDFDAAADHFAEALDRAGDPRLRADAAYNLGTTTHQALLAAPEAGTSGPDESGLDRARSALRDVLEHYRGALSLDPTNRDARANAELAYRQLRRLEALQQPEPEGQPQPQEGQDGASQDASQDASADASDSAQDGQPGNDEADPGDGEPPESESDPRTGEDGEPAPPDADTRGRDASPPPSEGTPTERQPAGAEDQADEVNAEPGTDTDREGAETSRMSRRQAERLLQRVRDLNRARREQLAEREQRRQAPVERDW